MLTFDAARFHGMETELELIDRELSELKEPVSQELQELISKLALCER